VAELVGLVSGERLAWLAESCGPLPDLGATASQPKPGATVRLPMEIYLDMTGIGYIIVLP
jgi:hypothetical protein